MSPELTSLLPYGAVLVTIVICVLVIVLAIRSIVRTQHRTFAALEAVLQMLRDEILLDGRYQQSVSSVPTTLWRSGEGSTTVLTRRQVASPRIAKDLAPASTTPTKSHANLESTQSPPHVALSIDSGAQRLVASQLRPAWLKGIRGTDIDLLINNGSASFGRSSSCSVVLSDPEVSRTHFTIGNIEGHWFVKDENTPNGTRVNGVALPPDSRKRLTSNDVISAGRVEIRFRVQEVSSKLTEFVTGARTTRGSRERNEDDYAVAADLLAVADGAGGRPAGNVASRLAISVVEQHYRTTKWKDVVREVADSLSRYAEQDPSARGLATTLEAARLVRTPAGTIVSGAHIGDGIAIVDDGIQLNELTTPHTIAAELAREGQGVAAGHHPDPGRLLSAIGMNSPKIDEWQAAAAVGHRFILSTDGLVRCLGPKNLAQALIDVRGLGVQAAADKLIETALDESSSGTSPAALDNLTVVVGEVVVLSASERGGRSE